MQIHVLLFAQLADTAGQRKLTLELADGATVHDAFDAVVAQHNSLASMRNRIAFAINERYAQANHTLHDGDTLALIPPVSGG